MAAANIAVSSVTPSPAALSSVELKLVSEPPIHSRSKFGLMIRAPSGPPANICSVRSVELPRAWLSKLADANATIVEIEIK